MPLTAQWSSKIHDRLYPQATARIPLTRIDTFSENNPLAALSNPFAIIDGVRSDYNHAPTLDYKWISNCHKSGRKLQTVTTPVRKNTQPESVIVASTSNRNSIHRSAVLQRAHKNVSKRKLMQQHENAWRSIVSWMSVDASKNDDNIKNKNKTRATGDHSSVHVFTPLLKEEGKNLSYPTKHSPSTLTVGFVEC